MLNPKNIPSRNLDLPEEIREIMQLRTFYREPNIMLKTDWDLRFLEMARFISGWSKDPSTKVGAVIVDQDKRIVSLGYNGFGRGIKDLEERYLDREQKYKLVIHGEMNAMLFADRRLLIGATLYTWPYMPCERCSTIIGQVKIGKVICPYTPDEVLTRWNTKREDIERNFEESNVTLFYKNL